MTSHGTAIWITGVALVIGTVTGTAACTLASPTYISDQQAADTSDSGTGLTPSSSGASTDSATAGGVATCGTTDFTKPDLSTLTACGDGKGHCYAKDKVSLAGELVPCADASMVCVPDEILTADGQPLKSCTSIVGPGGCVTATLVPQIIAQGGSALKPDVCSATQLCVPCTDPTTNTPTPFCQPIGVHEKSCAAPTAPATGGGAATSALPACCTKNGHSNGVCLTKTAIPSGQQSSAPQDICADGNLCVPAAFVANKPVTCNAGVFGTGVCMDRCFSSLMDIAGGIGILDQDICGDTEVCVSCQFVSGEGVPSCP